MSEELPLFFQVLIWLNLYWYVFLATFVPAIYYIFIKIVVFPLASNKPQEFVIMAKPEKVEIKKVSNRYHPFFSFKKGLYWFSTPVEDLNTYNNYHIYIQGMNQSVTEPERREAKLDDILQVEGKEKQVIGHQIRLPLKLKDHLHRHWTLTVEPKKKLAVLTPVKKGQPFRLSFYHTLGIYIQEEEEVEKEVEMEGSGGQNLIQMTNQTVIQQIKYIQNYSYFSSTSAFNLWKKKTKIEKLFVTWLKGGVDPMMGSVIVLAMAGVAVVAIMMMLGGGE